MTGCGWTSACERRAAGAAMSPADGAYEASVPVCVVHAIDARPLGWVVRRLRGGPTHGSWLPEHLVCVCVEPADDLAGTCGACGRELVTAGLVVALLEGGHGDESKALDRVRSRQGIEVAA